MFMSEAAKGLLGGKLGEGAPEVRIIWQRLVIGGDTCRRCGGTEGDVEGLLEERELSVGEFEADRVYPTA